MGPRDGQSGRFSVLLASLCDGEITPHEAAQLEQMARRSPEALDHFFRYVQMHGEIVWAAGHATGRRGAARAGTPSTAIAPAAAPSTAGSRAGQSPRAAHAAPRRRQWVALGAAAAALAVLGAGLALMFSGGTGDGGPAPAAEVPARLERAVRGEWAGTALRDGALLRAGRTLDLRRGLAQICFSSGACVILEGPAVFRVDSASRAFLDSGKLAASVPPEAVGFTVGTPSVTVVDRGTRLGIVADEHIGSEVHVFEGRVELQPVDASRPGPLPMTVAAGQAVRVQLGTGARPEIVRLPPEGRPFVQAMPPPGPCARLRALAGAHPRLLHHYTFEGATFAEKCADSRGSLHLARAPMSGGDGGGDLYELAPGFDPESNALRPFRGPGGEDAVGVGLQSGAALARLPAVTIELLAKLEQSEAARGGACALAALRGRQGEGAFCLAVTDGGRLAFRTSVKGPWTATGLALAPGDWHYVAVAIRTADGQTTVDCYAANLSRAERDLTAVVQGDRAEGRAAADGTLAVGAGFGPEGAGAYAWPGIVDEVAVYGAALPRETLQQHLDALLGIPP